MRNWIALMLLALPCSAVPAQAPIAANTVAAPDLSGLWVVSNRSSRGNLDEDFAPLKPEQYLTGKGKSALTGVRPALDPSSMCLPSIPRHLSGPYPIEIVQRPGRIAMLFEWDTVFRIIYTDARQHPDPEADQRYMGHAIGHWDGATLIVDTTNFNGKAWLEGSGLPMSDKAHLTEWYSLTEGGKTLQLIVKMEDPEYLSRPVWRKYLYNLKNDWAISEYFCAEGNRDNAFQQKEGQPGSIQKDDVIEE